jgi:signal transduction histidine kinase
VTIRARLALGIFTIALLMIVPLVISLRAIERVHVETLRLRDRDFAASLLVSRIRGDVDEARAQETLLGAFPSSGARDTLFLLVDRLASRADTLRTYQLGGEADSIRRAAGEIRRQGQSEYEAGIAQRGEVADSISEHHIAPALARVDDVLRGTERSLRTRIGQGVNRAEEATGEARRVALAGFGIAAVLGVFIGLVIWRMIADPLRDFEAGMAAVAGGNFGHALGVSPDRQDEFGRLARSFRSMADQLAELNRLRAEFISVASHELKTPINVVLGYVQLLQEGVYGAVTPKQREILKTLETQTGALARLVHQLLDISRFEAGGGKLELRTVPLDRFLNDLERTFHVLSVQRGIDFRIERNGPLPSEVYWDADRMNEVLGNLLANAFKFTDRDGAVELLVAGVDGRVHIAVRDTGAGIPPEHLPHIFEKFYQASNQEAASHGGTGLGLAIARQIVMAHGGEISVESTLGVGTTFEITLPVRAGQRSRVTPRSVPVGATA